MKPTYKSNPAHTAGMRGFNHAKTPEPMDAQTIYRNAIQGKDGKWYALAPCKEIYRYAGDGIGTAHFNGMTGRGSNSIELRDIPIEIRRTFGFLKG